MTNFIYNMQDELFHLPLEDFSLIKKLVDHIEAQGKQLRELNMTIEKKNKTIEKYEREKKELQKNNSYLIKKVDELNEGIRNSKDLTWKQKYDALLHSSKQAIGALQKKCQEYKNDAVPSVAKAVRCPWGNNAEIISAKTIRIKELEEKLKNEVRANKDLNTIINSKVKRIEKLEEENKKLERSNLDMGDTIGLYVEEFKKLKDYISELEAKVKDLEAANEKLLVQDRVHNGVISLSSELNTKIDNQRKEITRLLKNQETLKAEIMNKEQVADYIRVNNVLRRKLESIDALIDKIDDVIMSEE